VLGSSARGEYGTFFPLSLPPPSLPLFPSPLYSVVSGNVFFVGYPVRAEFFPTG